MQWLVLLILVPYIFFLLRIYLNLSKIKLYQPRISSEIFVSVIVACRNEEKNLPYLLSDISYQNYRPDKFELIIIDDNSLDSTFNVASSFSRIRNLKVLRNAGIGKKTSIKTGVKASAGKLIVTTDADCRIGREWLKTIVSFFNEKTPEMIICPVSLNDGKGLFHRFQELEFLSLQGITAGTADSGNPVMCNGANLVFLKETYLKYSGNLHKELVSGDDIFLLHNIKRDKGNKISWLESNEVMVTTKASETFHSFISQRARWISKAGSYTDLYTQLLAIVTFVTILAQLILLTCGFFSRIYLLIFGAFFILKTIPDFLILYNTATRYKKPSLMKWFVISQLIYPVYVFVVTINSLIHRSIARVSYPSPKGI
jgi:biofilm PGA synthesis N-glycosyltransferase PgaC